MLCDTLKQETTDNYSLTVSVTDRGSPPLNSSTVVSVRVLDINDNVPVFSSPEYHAQVNENGSLGKVLIRVSAYDPDLGANGTVTYNIISGNSRVDSATGVLEVNGTLDYEEDTKLTLTIQASDGIPNHKKVSFAIIYILVLDKNDNSPFFMFPIYNCLKTCHLLPLCARCLLLMKMREPSDY